MRTPALLLFLLGLLLQPLDALAQTGTVNFANGATGVDAPVTLSASEAGIEGPDWQAQLLFQQGTNLIAVSERIPFETNALAGYFFGGGVSVPGTKPGDAATFRIRVWNRDSVVGDSEPVQVVLGGEKRPPVNLTGLGSFQVDPVIRLSITKQEPGLNLSWPKEFASFRLQAAEDLVNWQDLSATRSTNSASVSVDLDISTNRQFYRLRSF